MAGDQWLVAGFGESTMKKIDSYWVSLAIIVIGLGLILFTVSPGGLPTGERFVMHMILLTTKVVAGAGLVTVGLITLTINDIFKKH